MNCLFCQIEISDQFAFVYTDTRGRKSDITHLTCQSCRTKYAYNTNKNSIMYFQIYGLYRQRTYVAHFNLDHRDFYLGDRSGEVAKIIFELDYLPVGITPSNFNDKLKTMLIFS